MTKLGKDHSKSKHLFSPSNSMGVKKNPEIFANFGSEGISGKRASEKVRPEKLFFVGTWDYLFFVAFFLVFSHGSKISIHFWIF